MRFRTRLPKVNQFAAALGFRLIFSFAGTRFAAARPAFPQFGLIVTPNRRGGASVEFGSPCGLTRC